MNPFQKVAQQDEMGETQQQDIFEFLAYFNRTKEEAFKNVGLEPDRINEIEQNIMKHEQAFKDLTQILIAFIDRFKVK